MHVYRKRAVLKHWLMVFVYISHAVLKAFQAWCARIWKKPPALRPHAMTAMTNTIDVRLEPNLIVEPLMAKRLGVQAAEDGSRLIPEAQ
jgi:hypothetical protein